MKANTFEILFIFPNINSDYCWSPAVQILSAVLKQKGFPVDLIHIHDEHGFPSDIAVVTQKINKLEPDLILFTATSFEYAYVNNLCGMVKSCNSAYYTVLGGIHATVEPESLSLSNFDCYCIGEGEKPILELAEKLSKGESIISIKSLWFKQDTKIIKNPVSQFIMNLDLLPFYDWEIMSTEKLLNKRNGWLSIGFSRGCPYSCRFCVNQALREIKGAKGYLRKRSIKNAIAELTYLAKKYEIKVFNLDDDLICLDKKWIINFCDKYKAQIFDKYKIKFTINARADLLDEEIVSHLKMAGCQEVQIGVECGDEKIRNNLLKKGISTEQIIRAVELVKKEGINILSYLMIGLPGETMESYRKTVELMAKIQTYLIRGTFYIPIPHTPLYDDCIKDQLINERKVDGHFSEPTLKYTEVSDADILRYKVLLGWYINAQIGYGYYRKLISRFQDDSYEEFKKREDLLEELDKDASMKHQGMPHYSYFGYNKNYIVLNN